MISDSTTSPLEIKYIQKLAAIKGIVLKILNNAFEMSLGCW